jgi:import inner membrane translocase subunit TIM50
LAEPVVAAFDKVGLFHYRLYREHHRLEGDVHLKDLDYLNRELSNVIVIETNSKRMRTHPENGVLLKKWEGQEGDEEIYKITECLHGTNFLT